MTESGLAPAPPAVRPRPHQVEALHAIEVAFRTGGRATVVAACGTGKTLLGCWAAQQVAPATVLVVVPSIALVAQTVQAWRAAGGWPFEALVVCSDRTTVAGQAEREAGDGGDIDTPFWARHRARVTTNPAEVGRVLSRRHPGRPIVLFSTYHSAWAVAAAARATGTVVDLVVADEAHHLAGRPRSDFRVVTDAEALPAVRRLFLTATPVVHQSREAPPAGSVAVSMDDETVFGPVVHRLDFAAAIDRGLLADYQVLIYETPGEVTPDPVGALLAAARAGLSRVLSFHGRVRKARAFAAAVDGTRLPDGRTVVARTVVGTDPATRRQQVLQMLADPHPNQLVVVASARCLSEGIDVPAVDGVLFVDPKHSQVDVVQAVGRALRTSPGKRHGLVMLPVCVPAGLDEDTALSTSAFAAVWRVLRSLRSLDARLEQALTHCRRDESRRGVADGSRTPQMIRFDTPSVDPARLLTRMVDLTSSAWDRWFDRLADHAAIHGHARPAPTAPLGMWAERQRTAHRRGLLLTEHADRLRSLFGWTWDLAGQRWLDQWGQVRRLADRDGRLPLHDPYLMGLPLVVAEPRSSVTTVGRWCAWQRVLRRRGDLDPVRRGRLDEIPGWTWSAVGDVDAVNVDLLADYAAWKGAANPPASYTDDGQPVGRWLNGVRRRRVTGHLPQPLLDEITVATPKDTAGRLRWHAAATQWMLGFEALRQFTAREGHARVVDGHVEQLPDTAITLYVWCRRARHQHRHGQLSPARADLLDRVPGWRWEIQPAPRVLLDIGDARHGTRTGYVKGCRCDGCTEANTADFAARSLRTASSGEPATDWVDAARARGHLRILAGRGAETKPLARAAGLNVKTVDGLIGGDTRRIHPATERAVLAVSLDDVRAAAAPGTRVPAGPTWVLLDDLLGRGWTKGWLARELGLGRSLQLRRDQVTARNAGRVATLHQRMAGLNPPPRQRRRPLPALTDLEPRLAATA